MPLTLPRRYQMQSALRAAMVTRAREPQKLRRPAPASAPAASNSGRDGTGAPSCSAKTHASKTAFPCLMRNSRVRCIEPGKVLGRTGDRVTENGPPVENRPPGANLQAASSVPSGLRPAAAALRRDERGRLPPLTGHDEFANGLAGAGGQFPVAQRLREGSGVARVTDGESGDGVKTSRDVKDLAGGVRIEAGHLVDEKSARGGFDAQKRHGRPGVVLRVAVGRLVLGEGQLRDRKTQYGGVLGPVDVEFDQRLQGFIEVFCVAAGRDNEVPGLLVAARGSPASGFEKAAQDFRRHVAVAESTGAPAIGDEFVDREFGGCGIAHVPPRSGIGTGSG